MNAEQQSVPLAVEKVLFRLALAEGGRVTIARAFIELPLSLEDLERHADKSVDGRALLKDEWGDFLAYDLPELKSGTRPTAEESCPTCGGERPKQSPSAPAASASTPTEAAAPAPPPPPTPLICDNCYRSLRRAARTRDESALARLKSLWKSEEDPEKVALVEHEIFHVALRLGGKALTHTAVAAQTLVAAALVKECLDRFASARYIRREISPDGVFFEFPPGLVYSEPAYRRFKGDHVIEPPREKRALDIKAKPAAPEGLKIVVKDKRQRPGQRPGG